MSFAIFGPSGNVVPLSASATTIVTPRSLWVGTAGTATLVDEAGNTLTDFPLLAGVNPIRITKLTALGTASDVWAMY